MNPPRKCRPLRHACFFFLTRNDCSTKCPLCVHRAVQQFADRPGEGSIPRAPLSLNPVKVGWRLERVMRLASPLLVPSRAACPHQRLPKSSAAGCRGRWCLGLHPQPKHKIAVKGTHTTTAPTPPPQSAPFLGTGPPIPLPLPSRGPHIHSAISCLRVPAPPPPGTV